MSEEVRRNQHRMRIARAVKADELNSDKGFCAICFIRWGDKTDVRHVGKLPCGHIFHLNCLKLWLRSMTTKFNGTCPRCQKRFMERCTVLLMPVYGRPRTRSI
ncbi:hypothetical protein V3C99_019090 [Haemonchus contortus]|uniref:RING-type domain-containing protein n=1 Tax=Haemonchus contortus TaxID=6289 RepID=A0A7I4Z889_HAECO